MKKRSTEGENALDWKRAILRGCVGLAVLLALLLALTAAYSRGVQWQGREGLAARCALFLAALISGWFSAARARRQKLLSGLLGECALCLLLILLGVFTREGPVFNISLLTAILVLLSGGFLGSVIAAGGAGRRSSVRRI